jgi:integrase
METLGPEREGWTEKKANAELRERLVRVERKGYRKPSPLTFREYAERWHEESQRRRDWKPKTVAAYRVVIDRLSDHFGSMPLAAVRPRDVAAYVAAVSADYAPNTVGRDVSVLHAIYSTAKREELAETNPAERAERPKPPRRRWRILEPVEVARVAQAFHDEQDRVAFLTLVLSGIRRHELVALRWADVDLVESVLRVRDSKTEDGIRSIALPPTFAEELWQHRRRSTYQGEEERVFHHPKTGGPFPPDAFRDALNDALARAGIEDYVRPFHDLRHTAITNDAAAGSSAIAVMTKAGHASMATTKRYLHLAGAVFRDEAEALERRLLGIAQTGESDE